MAAAMRLFSFYGSDLEYIEFLETVFRRLQQFQPGLFENVPGVEALLHSAGPKDDSTLTPEPQAKGASLREPGVRKCRTLNYIPRGTEERTQPVPPSQTTRAEEHSIHGDRASISCSKETGSKEDALAPERASSNAVPPNTTIDQARPGLPFSHYDPNNPQAQGASTSKTSVRKRRASDSPSQGPNIKERTRPILPSQTTRAQEHSIDRDHASISCSEETSPKDHGHDLKETWPNLDTIPRTDDDWRRKRKDYSLDTLDHIQSLLSKLTTGNLSVNFDDVTDHSLDTIGNHMIMILRQTTLFGGTVRLLVYLFFAFCLVVEHIAKEYSADNNNRRLLEKILGHNWKSLKDLRKAERNRKIRKLINGWLQNVLPLATGQASNSTDKHLRKLKTGAVNMIKTLENVFQRGGGNCVFELIIYYDRSLPNISECREDKFRLLEDYFSSILPSAIFRQSVPLRIPLLLLLWWPFSYDTVRNALGLEHLKEEEFDRFSSALKEKALDTYLARRLDCNTPSHTLAVTPRSRRDDNSDNSPMAKRRRIDSDESLGDGGTDNDENHDLAPPRSASSSRTSVQACSPIAGRLVSHSVEETSSQSPDRSNVHDTASYRRTECAGTMDCETSSQYEWNMSPCNLQFVDEASANSSRAPSHDAIPRHEMHADGGYVVDECQSPPPTRDESMPAGNEDNIAAAGMESQVAVPEQEAEEGQPPPQDTPGRAPVVSARQDPLTYSGGLAHDDSNDDVAAAATLLAGMNNADAMNRPSAVRGMLPCSSVFTCLSIHDDTLSGKSGGLMTIGNECPGEPGNPCTDEAALWTGVGNPPASKACNDFAPDSGIPNNSEGYDDILGEEWFNTLLYALDTNQLFEWQQENIST
ncbi:hypothetical protein B0T10DRAFT_496162 [Thelonectria olida]|uniref:Uncharacterized protein n=1 Tax=Thelonectria olida TaxID=1576542 RepID=A0A9P8VUB2_9HYPO|nr:hypothetical protein B0T10DRAFT_496083 [Thelonectria olida]KAH6879805.1 hypothetical protein B0T10DRAFT_496162 [Thelonectria olida]